MKMADTDNKITGPESKESAQPIKQQERREQETREVREAKISVDIQGIPEEAETGAERVSEKVGEKKERYDGSGATTTGGQQAQQIKKKLPPLPSAKTMKVQVETELKKEIKQLHKKIKKVMKKPGNFEAHQLNTLTAQLRKLKELLSSLAYATTEAIKDMWMRFVKKNT
jgi:hypothetical protein